MGTAGVIFGAIALAWLAYLVPHFVRRRDDERSDEVDDVGLGNRFADSIRIIRRGTAPLLDQDLAEIKTFEVSTPRTRQAAINDLRRLESLAADRRRRVLLILLAVISLTVGFWGAELFPWWSIAISGGLLVAFAAGARFSVTAMRRRHDARCAAIVGGSDETTVFISRKEIAATLPVAASVPSAPGPVKVGVLWDPLPITAPTYVSKPLAPRTVRTIDLSGPTRTISSQSELPVTADAPISEETDAAVGAEAVEGDSTQAASA